MEVIADLSVHMLRSFTSQVAELVDTTALDQRPGPHEPDGAPQPSIAVDNAEDRRSEASGGEVIEAALPRRGRFASTELKGEQVSAAPGSTAVRLESFVISSAPYASGGYPDLDDLFRQQTQERDRKKRAALLHQIQRLMHERIMFGPIFEPATLHGVGPRVEEPAIGLNTQLYFAAPYEDIRLKKP